VFPLSRRAACVPVVAATLLILVSAVAAQTPPPTAPPPPPAARAVPAQPRGAPDAPAAERAVPPPAPETLVPFSPHAPRPLRDALRFEATVFRLTLPPERVVDLDAAQLSVAAPNAAALSKTLAGLGDAQALYRVDQAVALDSGGQKLTVSRDRPYVTGRVNSKSGESSVSVGRQRLGASFEFSGSYPESAGPADPELSLQVELSTLENSDVPLGNDVLSPQFCQISQRFLGRVQLGRPIVLLTCDAAGGTPDGKATAYVTLVRLSNPEPRKP
jgi:hypothetical protein